MGGSQRWKATQPMVAVAAVALLSLLVALASRASTEAAPAAAAAAARVTVDTVVYLLAAFTIAAIPVLVWLLWPQRDGAPVPVRPRRRNPLLAAVPFGVAVLALVLLRSRLGALPPFQARLPAPSAHPRGLAAAQAGAASAGPDWPALVIAAALLAALAFLGWRALRAPRTRPPAGRPASSELQAVLDDALASAAAEPDPRRAVISAWARVERILAERGLPRHPSQAPFEYARTASRAARLDPRALEGLAALYEWARFSQHEVTQEMRREALERLTEIREGIGLAA